MTELTFLVRKGVTDGTPGIQRVYLTAGGQANEPWLDSPHGAHCEFQVDTSDADVAEVFAQGNVVTALFDVVTPVEHAIAEEPAPEVDEDEVDPVDEEGFPEEPDEYEDDDSEEEE